MAEILARGHRLLVAAQPVIGRHDGREQRGQPGGLFDHRLAAGVVHIGIGQRQRRHDRAQRVDRFAFQGQHAQHLFSQRRQLARGAQLARKVLQLRGGGQFAIPEQIGYFLKTRLLRQVVYIIAAVAQPPHGAFHQAQSARCHDNALKPLCLCWFLIAHHFISSERGAALIITVCITRGPNRAGLDNQEELLCAAPAGRAAALGYAGIIAKAALIVALATQSLLRATRPWRAPVSSIIARRALSVMAQRGGEPIILTAEMPRTQRSLE